MPKRSRFPHLYQKRGRWYANLSSYEAWGGKCEAMIPPGERFATTDATKAAAVLTARLAELQRAKKHDPFPRQPDQITGRPDPSLTFALFAELAFDRYAETGRATDRHVKDLRQRARAFAAFLGPRIMLEDVTEANVGDFLGSLARRGLKEPSQRHYLNAISVVYRRAKAENLLSDRRFNPARDLDDKPRPSSGGEAFLEVHEAALLLDTARLMSVRPGNDGAAMTAYIAIAAGLLTGGRRLEVMGLLRSDIEFREGEESVSFSPREDRRLKTRGSRRRVPLWPQLRELLRPFLNAQEAAWLAKDARPSAMLFPSADGHGFVRDIGKSFCAVVTAAGLEARFQADWWRVLRRTYATTRLQTLDGDKPVSEYTVERELGHGSGAMLRRVYGKVSGTLRQRLPEVEYRLERFTAADSPLSRSRREELAEMLTARAKRLGLNATATASEVSIATR